MEYDNIILLLAEVLSEEVILKWFKDGHAVKGKMMFLEQMKKFIEWLQNAEEGMYCLCLINCFINVVTYTDNNRFHTFIEISAMGLLPNSLPNFITK